MPLKPVDLPDRSELSLTDVIALAKIPRHLPPVPKPKRSLDSIKLRFVPEDQNETLELASSNENMKAQIWYNVSIYGE